MAGKKSLNSQDSPNREGANSNTPSLRGPQNNDQSMNNMNAKTARKGTGLQAQKDKQSRRNRGESA